MQWIILLISFGLCSLWEGQCHCCTSSHLPSDQLTQMLISCPFILMLIYFIIHSFIHSTQSPFIYSYLFIHHKVHFICIIPWRPLLISCGYLFIFPFSPFTVFLHQNSCGLVLDDFLTHRIKHLNCLNWIGILI